MTLYEIYKAQLLGYSADTHTQIVANWLKNSADGTVEVFGTPPLTLTNCKGGKLVSYTITGNTVQDGEPSPDVPVEVLGVGNYDTVTGKYKIPVTVSGGEQTETSNIYLDTPLMKDEVLYSIGTRDVKWRKHVVNIKSTYNAPSGNILGISAFTTEQDYGMYREMVFCNITTKGDSTIVGSCYTTEKNICFVGTPTDTLESLQEKYNGAIVYYHLKTPTTQTLAVPTIQTIKSASATLSVDTTVQPSNVSVTYTTSKSYAQSEQQLTSQLLDVMEGIE